MTGSGPSGPSYSSELFQPSYPDAIKTGMNIRQLLRTLTAHFEVLRLVVGKELLSPEWAERVLSWRHCGFNVHSRVRARTKAEAERVGKYRIRPVLALDRLLFLEREGKVGYRHGHNGVEQETMDYKAAAVPCL